MVAVQLFVAPGGSRTRFYMLTGMSAIVFLVVLHHLSSTDPHNAARALLEQRRRQHVSHAATLYNYSVGLVWPSRSNTENDRDDRIMSQINVMNVYARQKRDRKLKIIMRVGNFNFENWLAGQDQFVRDECPIVT